ncbi:MAG TPA: FKBP-type peptidyl-prolyl cis-trans isomerase [Nitriliruptorales bacterium]|nr:FKBP-type peptidyl-prolyl cis-trans isomerase [Nitriliruptorales bacterium]
MRSVSGLRRRAPVPGVLVASLAAACALRGGGTADNVTGSDPPPPPVADLAEKPQVPVPQGVEPTRLTVTDIVVGSGVPAAAGDVVTVNLVGVRHADGHEATDTWDRGRPVTFRLDQVVPGVAKSIGGTEGIDPMRVGGRRLALVPADDAYGTRPDGAAPAGALVFVIDLIAVVR